MTSGRLQLLKQDVCAAGGGAGGDEGLNQKGGVGLPVGTSSSKHLVVFCGGVPPGLSVWCLCCSPFVESQLSPC